jgi:hypothetical protein
MLAASRYWRVRKVVPTTGERLGFDAARLGFSTVCQEAPT